MKIIHAADFHLDSPFSGLSADRASLRREEQRTLLERLADLANEEQADLVLTGGPMMGTPQSDLSAPVVKNTNAVIFLTARERRGSTEESVCIRCGKCVAACPMHLAPAFIDRTLRLDEVHRLVKLHPEDCLQCGCCSYICPARIPLLERVRQACERLEEGGFLK